MKIGCPRELKEGEFRVGLTPTAVKSYVSEGHQVYIQKGAGLGAGFSDEDYQTSEARIVDAAPELWQVCDLIVKAKEPLPAERDLMKEGQIIYTSFHFATDRDLTMACLNRKITAVAYERIRESDGSLPLLRPMSEIAGSVAPLLGAFYLGRNHGGAGLLISGVAGVAPGNVLVIGGGVVGTNAARIAAGLGARVTVLDSNVTALQRLRTTMPPNVVPLFFHRDALEAALREADIIIGAVLVPGMRTPQLVKREDLKIIKKGAVMVDIDIDEGGCFESSHPTTHSNPIFIEEGIIHYCVPNVPGAYAHTASSALNSRSIKYGLEIADKGVLAACRDDDAVRSGLTTYEGVITSQPLAATLGLEDYYKALDEITG